jgi:hypothetical protein
MSVTKCTFVVRLKSLTVSTYWNYDFSGFTIFSGISLGCGYNGIFQLDTGDSDNGTVIYAYFSSVLTDFGLSNLKRIVGFALGLRTSGSVLTTLTADEGRTILFTLTGNVVSLLAEGLKKVSNHQVVGRYWSLSVENVAGCDFSVDKVIANISVLQRKFADRSRYGKSASLFEDFTIEQKGCFVEFPEAVIEGVVV